MLPALLESVFPSPGIRTSVVIGIIVPPIVAVRDAGDVAEHRGLQDD
jgi:hypothetical protein